MLSESKFKRRISLWSAAGLTAAEAKSTTMSVVQSNYEKIAAWINSDDSNLSGYMWAEVYNYSDDETKIYPILRLNFRDVDAGIIYGCIRGTNYAYTGYVCDGNATTYNKAKKDKTISTTSSTNAVQVKLSDAWLILVTSKNGYICDIVATGEVENELRMCVANTENSDGQSLRAAFFASSGQYVTSIVADSGVADVTMYSDRSSYSNCLLTRFSIPKHGLISDGVYMCDGANVSAGSFYEVGGKTFCNITPAYSGTTNIALLIEEE